MNLTKLTDLIPTEPEIKKIGSKHTKILASVNTAKCIALNKNKGAEKFINYALASIDELHQREIGVRALIYAHCAEAYSIIGDNKSAVSYADLTVKEIMKAKSRTSIRYHDKIIISIARAGVNLNNTGLIDTAGKLCNKARDRNYLISGLCCLGESYALLGETKNRRRFVEPRDIFYRNTIKKALAAMDDAQHAMQKRNFYIEELGYRLGDIGMTIAKIGEISKDIGIIASAAAATVTLGKLVEKRIDEKFREYEIDEPDTDFSYERKTEYAECVMPASMRVVAAEVCALLKIGRSDDAKVLIDGAREFWDSGIVQEYNKMGMEFFGNYAFCALVELAEMFYKINDEKLAMEILKYPQDYFFGEPHRMGWLYHIGSLPALIKMVQLLEDTGDKNAEKIINKIYDEIKCKDADSKAGMLSEILFLIQKTKNKNQK